MSSSVVESKKELMLKLQNNALCKIQFHTISSCRQTIVALSFVGNDDGNENYVVGTTIMNTTLFHSSYHYL